jgi:hypothetical protein
MNTVLRNIPQPAGIRWLAAALLLSMSALVACQSPPSVMTAAAAAAGGVPGAAMPAPQVPFDTTPVTPVESADAAAE